MKLILSRRNVEVSSDSPDKYQDGRLRKSVLSLSCLLRGFGAGIVALCITSPLSASVTVIYTGNPFNLFVGPGFGLTQSNSVKAQITFSSPLPPNLSRSACTVDTNVLSLVQDWSISDGVHKAQASNSGISNLTFATDASGAITSWCFGGVSSTAGFQISTVSGSGFQGPFGSFTNGYDEASECCNNAAYAWNEQGSWKEVGCQVNACGSGATDNCVQLSNGGTSMYAQFTPPAGQSLIAAAVACGFRYFDWQQQIEFLPDPSPFFQDTTPPTHLTSTSPPFYDPPLGGYTYAESQQPPFLGAYPFVYNTIEVQGGCAQEDPEAKDCVVPITLDLGGGVQKFNFVDSPYDSCFVGGKYAGTTTCGGSTAPAGSYIRFSTALVGILPGTPPKASNPLFQWAWIDSFNGIAAGSIAVLPPPGQTTSIFPVDPKSGTGGITIVSINGSVQMPPAVTCSATPNALWPPNGKSVVVTISGAIIQGTQPIAGGGTAYGVIDEYGQVQPSGSITLGTGGIYSFGVSLIAARNGDNQDGRAYTIVVGAKDAIGNMGSCSAVVTVPHDQGQ